MGGSLQNLLINLTIDEHKQWEKKHKENKKINWSWLP